MTLFIELAISALLIIGGFFLFVGSFALAKLPDTMRRLHGPTKATTLGIGSILVASMLYFLFERGDLSIHELLITLFLFLTAPVSAHLIAKACLRDRPTSERLPDRSLEGPRRHGRERIASDGSHPQTQETG
jgi:multicomponent K+:H+ antiporter subunit G